MFSFIQIMSNYKSHSAGPIPIFAHFDMFLGFFSMAIRFWEILRTPLDSLHQNLSKYVA